MVNQGIWSVPRAAGAFLVLGVLAAMIGVLMFVGRGGTQRGAAAPSPGLFAVERSFIMAGVVLTAVGFLLLEGYFQNTAGHVLARAGATAYLLAATLLVAAEAFALNQGHQNVYPLIVIYVVLAFLAQAAIGGALLQSRLLPAWIAYAAIVWNLAWLVVLPITTPSDVYFPVLHHFVPLLVGAPLLWRGS
jgi:hypothetical protein